MFRLAEEADAARRALEFALPGDPRFERICGNLCVRAEFNLSSDHFLVSKPGRLESLGMALCCFSSDFPPVSHGSISDSRNHYPLVEHPMR